jgi:broad specificity phosphatase PhoE
MGAIVTRWWWIRHAPVPGQAGRIHGQADHPADCSDAATFTALAAQLPHHAVWVTSHLQRTQQTAQAIAAAMAGPTDAAIEGFIEPDLAEQNFGAWQGLTFEELAAQSRAEHDEFWQAPASGVPPGGESFIEVVARVEGAIGRLTAAHRGRDIVAVGHGGSIRAALTVALGVKADRALAFAIDPCSLTRLDHIQESGALESQGAAWRVVGVNLPMNVRRL